MQPVLMRQRRRESVAFATLALAVLAIVSPAASVSKPNLARPLFTLTGTAVGSRGTTTRIVPGPPPAFAWPRVGQAAVAVLGVGLVGSSPQERPVPIASLTKIMTALVILHDHPLALGQSGPVIPITASDVAEYESDVAAGDNTVRVVVGETLTEYELLEALLIPSGDNIAELLATWDAGSVANFVAKMNATADVLGLASTHYADPSGVSPSSVSTASDQAMVTAKLMESAVVRSIVRRTRLAFPVAGNIPSYNPALGIDGIIGVKSGWTSEAKSCLVTAAFRSVRRRGVLVISVALGQPGGPVSPARVDETLLATATKALVAYRFAHPGAAVATVTLPGENRKVYLLAPREPSFVVVWHGLRLTQRIIGNAGTFAAALASKPAGSLVGRLQVLAPWGVVATLPLRIGTTFSST
jgi:D-alanyl-D-alanine carboxypeptidase (penicillin-binding protein 5/6)